MNRHSASLWTSPRVPHWVPPPARYYVGAAVDLGKVKQRHTWATTAKDDADGWRDTALSTHTNYKTALATNSSAWTSNDELRKVTLVDDAALAALSEEDAALVNAYHAEAVQNLGFLVTDRQAIAHDLAAHWVIKFPAAQPVGSLGVTLEGAAATFDAHPAAPPPAYDPGGGDPFFSAVSKSYQDAVGKWKYAQDLAAAALSAHHSQQAALDALNDAIAAWSKVQADADTLQAITLGQPDKAAKLATYSNIAADRIAQGGKLKQTLIDDLAAHGPGEAPPPSGAESELAHRIGTVFVLIGLGAAALFVLAPATAAVIYSKVRKAAT